MEPIKNETSEEQATPEKKTESPWMQVSFTLEDIESLAHGLEGNFANSNIVKFAIATSLKCKELQEYYLKRVHNDRVRESANRQELENRIQSIPAAEPGKRKRDEEASEETKDA